MQKKVTNVYYDQMPTSKKFVHLYFNLYILIFKHREVAKDREKKAVPRVSARASDSWQRFVTSAFFTDVCVCARVCAQALLTSWHNWNIYSWKNIFKALFFMTTSLSESMINLFNDWFIIGFFSPPVLNSTSWPSWCIKPFQESLRYNWVIGPKGTDIFKEILNGTENWQENLLAATQLSVLFLNLYIIY